MKAIHRAAIMTLSAAIVGVMIGPAAIACGPELGGPLQLGGSFKMQQLRTNADNPLESITSESLAHDQSKASNGGGASIVGMWSFQWVSQGNTSFPDGTMLDFGYNQWHSDNTEVLGFVGACRDEVRCKGVFRQTEQAFCRLCPHCEKQSILKNGRDRRGAQVYRCTDCCRSFTALTGTPFSGHSFPPTVIGLAVRWYLRFRLSYADVVEWLAERGITVDPSTVFDWVQKFAPLYQDAAKAYRHRVGLRWSVDET